MISRVTSTLTPDSLPHSLSAEMIPIPGSLIWSLPLPLLSGPDHPGAGERQHPQHPGCKRVHAVHGLRRSPVCRVIASRPSPLLAIKRAARGGWDLRLWDLWLWELWLWEDKFGLFLTSSPLSFRANTLWPWLPPCCETTWNWPSSTLFPFVKSRATSIG